MKKARNEMLGNLKERQRRAATAVFVACSTLKKLEDPEAIDDALNLYSNQNQTSNKKLDFLRKHNVPGDLLRILYLNFNKFSPRNFLVNEFINRLIYMCDKAHYSKLWGLPRDSLLLGIPRFKKPKSIKRSYSYKGKHRVLSHMPSSVNTLSVQGKGMQICDLMLQPLLKYKAEFMMHLLYSYHEFELSRKALKQLVHEFSRYVLLTAKKESYHLPALDRQSFITEITQSKTIESIFQAKVLPYMDHSTQLLELSLQYFSKYVPALDKYMGNVRKVFEQFHYNFHQMIKELQSKESKSRVDRQHRLWMTDFLQPFINACVDPVTYSLLDFFNMPHQKFIDEMEEYVVNSNSQNITGVELYCGTIQEVEGILEFFENVNLNKVLTKLRAPKRLNLGSQVNSFKLLLQKVPVNKLTSAQIAINNKIPHSTVKYHFKPFNAQIPKENIRASTFTVLTRLGVEFSDQINSEVAEELRKRNIDPVYAKKLIHVPTEEESKKEKDWLKRAIERYKKKHANTGMTDIELKDEDDSLIIGRAIPKGNSKNADGHKEYESHFNSYQKNGLLDLVLQQIKKASPDERKIVLEKFNEEISSGNYLDCSEEFISSVRHTLECDPSKIPGNH